MKKFFKKIFVVLALFVGAVSLTGCQSTQKNAYIADGSVTTEIYRDSSDQKYCMVTMGFVNPSIYDCIQFTCDVTTYSDKAKTQVIATEDDYPMNVRLRHGNSALVTFSFKVENNQVEAIKLTDYKATKYDSIWGSYLGWWLAGIICVGLALFFYILTLCQKHLTKDELIQGFREHLASSTVFATVVLIFCIFPLVFGSWVSCLILLGSYFSFIIAAFLFTWIRSLFAKA